jgi:L-threonate 2-dehydrogenase
LNRIGIIGLGSMGAAIAAALLRAGHEVSGFDIDSSALERFRAAGGIAKPNAEDVAVESDLVVVIVRDEEQIESLLSSNAAALGSLRKDVVLWIASTVSPDYIATLGERLLTRGMHVLDGPVSGGVARAQAGKLTAIFAGSDRAVCAATVFAPAIAEHVFRVASFPGPASAVKAINQLLAASHIALAAEALGLALRAGVDPEILQKVVNTSAGASRMFSDRVPRMLADDHAPHATIGVFLKDIQIAIDLARQRGATTPVAEAARDVFSRAATVIGSDIGDPAIFALYRPDTLHRI